MKKINGAVLKAGDIVLPTSTELVSKVIRFSTRSDISHAMVCVEAYSVIDATLEVVHARNVQRFGFEDECAVYILRPVQPLDAKQLKGIYEYVRQKNWNGIYKEGSCANPARRPCGVFTEFARD